MSTIAETFALALQHLAGGQLQLAEDVCQQVLKLDPQHAPAHGLMGVIALQRGRPDLAITLLGHALSLEPDSVACYYYLGLAQGALGRNQVAVASFQNAIRLKPDFVEAHYEAAVAHCNLGNHGEAEACCRQALTLRPDYADAHFSLANSLVSQRKWNEAAYHYQRTLDLKPDCAAALGNMGLALQAQGELDRAVECHVKALRADPTFAQGHQNLGVARMAQGQPEQALGCFREALRLRPNLSTAQSSFLWCLNYQPDVDPQTVFEEHCRWGRLIQPSTPTTPHSNDPNPQRPLRVGYVSGDLYNHALTRYLEPVLAHHDTDQLTAFCYAEVGVPDAVTARLQGLVHAWRWTCGRADAEVAEQIRNDGIDILVDLAGHTSNNRLGVFAQKPAPVQATWLGYLNTTGLATVDFRLTDEVLDPPGQSVRDTEALLRLPGGFCCFAAPSVAPDVSELPALKRQHLTFGSPHSLFKLNPGVLDLWSHVLLAVPSARLLVFRDTLTGKTRDHLHQEFTRRGIAAERIDLRASFTDAAYLNIYEEIDVGLDAFPWSGGVTTCESLWMGVPVLSLRGKRPAARNSAALLTRVGLSEWAVDTPGEYISFAKSLATDLNRLAQLRRHLRETVRTALCDARSFTRVLENAYRTMWQKWCAANDPCRVAAG